MNRIVHLWFYLLPDFSEFSPESKIPPARNISYQNASFNTLLSSNDFPFESTAWSRSHVVNSYVGICLPLIVFTELVQNMPASKASRTTVFISVTYMPP